MGIAEIRGNRLGAGVVVAAGVVDQHVEVTVGPLYVRSQRRDAGILGDIEGPGDDIQAFTPKRVRMFFSGLKAAGGQQHAKARLRELTGDLPSESGFAGSTGNEGEALG